MTLSHWNSFQYGSTGWTLNNVTRTGGAGQSGYASLRSTAGVDGNSILGLSSMTHAIFGFCFKHSNILGSNDFFNLESGSGSGYNFSLEVGAAGEIVAKRTNQTVELGRSISGIMASNVETYVEVRIKAGTGTSGEVEVRVNGDPTPVLDLPATNTDSASFIEVTLTGKPSGTRDFSAFYYITVDATPPNDFLGHIRFGVLTADGNGANSDFNGSDGNSTDNYLLIDDPAITPDDDSTYVQSASVGDKDTYAMTALPTTPLSVIAVCPIIRAKKTDAGSRGITPIIRSGGTDYQGTTEHFLSTSYSNYKQAFLQNPDGPADWDETSVNAMEVGMEVTT